ncbi:MAG TPA: winged helix-turn-helix transcriptional regulator [Actinomycetes bacterium]
MGDDVEQDAGARSATRWAGADPTCAVAQAAVAVGDRWSLVILREITRGHCRFDALVTELRISRKVLTERLTHLVEHGLLERVAYQQSPVRHDYRLTPAGHAFVPVLVALQDWGDRWLLGDGALSATSRHGAPDAERVQALVGRPVPAGLALPSTTGGPRDVVAADRRATVVFAYPATGRPTPLPDGWADIPGAIGCTLENRLFRDSFDLFTAADVAVQGVSTQRPDEQRAFAEAEDIPFPLMSDADLELAAALRLPTFRAGGVVRLRRLVLVIGADRVVRAVRYPVDDIADAVAWSLARSKRAPTDKRG